MNDEELVKLLRTGKETAAFKQLYAGLPAVRKYIKANGGTKADALDVFQEALVVFCRKVRDTNFELTAAISTYLYSTSRFLWLEELRRRGKMPKAAGEMSDNWTEAPHWSNTLEDEAKYSLAEQALAKMSTKCKEVIVAFYTQKMRMAEIAERFGFSSEKVAKNQKYKCMERARKHLILLQNQSSKTTAP